MKILLVGSGGREHALAWKLSQSPRLSKLFAAPGSDAIATLAECVDVTEPAALADFAEKEAVELTVVGPEAPLVAGLVDEFTARGLTAFGPTSRAAALEGSKVFAKDFMRRHGIPSPPYRAFNRAETALDYVRSQPVPLVVKADGLAAGKGVFVCRDRESAERAVHTIMVERAFGEAGEWVVVEECLEGEEASFFVVSDGQHFFTLPSAQDHKPIGDLDRGPNTGGMGAYCPAPVVSPEMERRILSEVVEPTLRGMAAEGNPYRGVLYVGLMISQGTPQVLEYNCRFGDPECQALMMMLDSDLVEILESAAKGRLNGFSARWREGSAACIVMASGGYPGEFHRGRSIRGLDVVEEGDSCRVFHAGTARSNGRWVTNGGRVLGVTAWGPDLATALATGYRAAEGLSWEKVTYRRDIGLKGLKHDRGGRPATSVGIIVGSVTDLEVARQAGAILERLGIGFEMAVTSAHRTPERTRRFVRACETSGVEVFIAVAGMAAALPGAVAAETSRPVVGVPVNASSLDGLDSLLSIAQMPPGVPVATVAVGGGSNAALLAAQMLALKYPDIRAGLQEYRIELALKVEGAHRDAGLSTLL